MSLMSILGIKLGYGCACGTLVNMCPQMIACVLIVYKECCIKTKSGHLA